MIARSVHRAARGLMPILVPAVLASMACQEIKGPQIGTRQNPPQPGQFFLDAVNYTLYAGDAATQGGCNADVGPGCPTSIHDETDGSGATLSFGLTTPTQTMSSLNLAFYLSGSSTRLSAEVTATAETTLFSATAGKKVFARVRRNEQNLRGDITTVDEFSLRVGEGGAPIAVPVGDDYTEVTLPAGPSTIFADVHVTLTEEAGSVGDADVTYVLEIVPDAPCKTDTRCPPDQKCVTPAGVCTTGEVGADCADPQDCDSGICYSGHCSDGSVGSFCSTDLDCQTYCVNFHCQAGNQGDYCITAGQCNFAGAFCPLLYFSYGQCTDGGISDFCVVDDDCAAELDCNGGVCGP